MENVDIPNNIEDEIIDIPEEDEVKKVANDKPPSKKKLKSSVWDQFLIPDPIPKDNARCCCKYCKKAYAYNPGKLGTSSLRNHLFNQCKAYPFRNNVDKTQKTLLFQPKKEGRDGGSLVAVAYSKEACRKALARMVIVDELPFRFVEKEGFVFFCSQMQPKFELPCRTTVARDVIALYVEEKNKLKDMFTSTAQQVCLTTDAWTSLQNTCYMVLTAHYIDEDWNLQKKILNFECISNHKGETIGKMIETCLLSWGIDKVFTITVDNASSNDVALAYIKRRIRNWGKATLDGDFMHMRCGAHILNLIVKDGLGDYDTSLQVIRNAVRFVRSSPSRLQKFNECVKKERLDVERSVCLDVPTRWNSTFMMLEAALKFKRAFEHLEEDGQYTRYFVGEAENGKRRLGPPCEMDWEAANNFMKFLKVFYEVTKRFSGSLYVTSNNYFHDICLMHDHITNCMRWDDEKLKKMALGMKDKYDKYWGEPEKINPLLFVATILDPRYKQEYVDWSLADMYEDDDLVGKMKKRVNETLRRLFEHYRAQDPEHGKGRTPAQQNTHFGGSDREGSCNIHERRLRALKSYLKEGENGEKTELDKYLADAIESMDDTFDLLGWWKANSTKYKILSRVARDVLAVPVSTVASESAFSTGGRVLDAFRSNLTPKTVQALICAQNWLRNEVKKDKVDLRGSLKEIEELEGVEKDFMHVLNICTDHIE